MGAWETVSGLGQILANYTATQAFFSPYLFTGLAPAWSLTIEECFYLFAPVIFVLLPKSSSRARSLLSLASVTLGLWAVGVFLQRVPLIDGTPASAKMIEIYSLFGRMGEFATGMLAAYWIPKGPGRFKKPRPWNELGLAAFVAALVATHLLLDSLRVSTGLNYGINAPRAVLVLWLLALGTAALIWSTAQGSRLSHLILGNPAAELLGRTSFCFYLLQDRFFADPIRSAIDRYTPFTSNQPWAVYVALNAAAYLAYAAVERPMHARILALSGATGPRRTARS